MSGRTASVSGAAKVCGEVRVPSDKSLTHRALILGAMSSGVCTVRNPLDAGDTRATAACLSALGIPVEWGSEIQLEGSAFCGRDLTLDCGNSGTTMRLLLGPLSAAEGVSARLVGDASLSRRPMSRVVEPLRLMGASAEGDRPPVSVEGARLKGIDYQTPVASAQIKSCVLLAGSRASGTTRVMEPSPSRDHTERMLRHLGVRVTETDGWIAVEGGASWGGFDFSAPADISSAAFWMVAAALHPGSTVVLRDVGVNPTRSGILDVLKSAGVRFSLEDERTEFGEPVATVVVSGDEGLRPFEISGALVPRLIDEIPVLAVLATQCHGTTTIRDAAELRVKESDRLAIVGRVLSEMGAKVEELPDGLVIEGPTPLSGSVVECDGDHRIGMAFAVAGTIATGETTLVGTESVETSYPAFFADLRRLTSA